MHFYIKRELILDDAIFQINSDKFKENSMIKTVPCSGYDAPCSLIMTSGDYYKKTKEIWRWVGELDPEIAFLDKWDIFNKPVWQKWQNML